MPKSLFAAALLTFSAPTLAQTAAPVKPAAPMAMPPAKFIQAAQAFGQCLARTTQAVSAAARPEVAAHQAVAGCATEKTALDTRFEAWVAGPGFPQEKRDEARAQYKAQTGNLETQIAEDIRASRPTATPTPAPAPLPAPRR